MTGRRRALIIANDTYEHASLGQLRAPAADAEALAAVLGDPEIGGFSVSVVHNEPSHEVQARIEDEFADSLPDDLLLLHFSGHGIKSDTGELFVAARNTRPDRLGSTGVSADFIQRCMRSSRARSVVLLLDCCYGGAFGEGVAVRAAGPVNVMDSFPASHLGGGRGRAVISASSAIEYAFEGTTLAADERAKPSVFTSAVVDGLRSGDADRDEDGLVSLDELYDYVFDRVRAENPKQTPGRDVEMAGDLYIAHSRRKRLRATPIPEAVAAALRETNPTFRRGAVSELRDRLWHEDPSAALGALEALREVARTDTKAVAEDAAAAIDSVSLRVDPPTVDFAAQSGGGEVTTTIEVAGPALARAVTVEAQAPLEALVDEVGRVVVTLRPTSWPFEGQLTITSPVGTAVVPVRAAASELETGAPISDVVESDVVESHEPESDVVEHAALADSVAEREPATTQPEVLVERRITPVPLANLAPGSGSQQTSPANEPSTPGTLGAVGPSSPDAAEGAAPPVLSAGVRRVAAVTASLGGLLVVVSTSLPWKWSDPLSAFGPGLLTGIYVVALTAIVSGITAAVDQKGLVASGLVLGVSVVAVNGTLTAFGVMADLGTGVVAVGWWLALLGQLAMVLAGASVLISLLRGSRLVLTWPAGPDPARLAAIGLSVIACGSQVAYALVLSDREGGKGYPSIAMIWAVTCLAVGAFAMSLSPVTIARAFLVGFAVAALAEPLSDWSYLQYYQGPATTYLGVTFVAFVALIPAGILLGRKRPAMPPA